MGYVEENLMVGEEVIYKANIHWMVYLPALFVVFLSFIIIMVGGELFRWIGFLLLVVGLLELIKAYFFRISTELVITTKRVIAKFGFIRRNTIELNHKKVESLSVHQNILQRILNAGTITIHGTGSGITPITYIDEPLIFRTNAMEIIDKQ